VSLLSLMATPSIALPLASRCRCCRRRCRRPRCHSRVAAAVTVAAAVAAVAIANAAAGNTAPTGVVAAVTAAVATAASAARRLASRPSGVAAGCHVCRQRLQSAPSAPPSQSLLSQVPWLQLVASASTELQQNTTNDPPSVRLWLQCSRRYHPALSCASDVNSCSWCQAAATDTYTSTLRHRSKQRPVQVSPPWQTRGSQVAVCAPAAVSRRWPEQLRRVGPTTMLLPRYRSGQRGGGQ